MSKAALREQRRAQRIAKRNRQRSIIGIIAALAVVLIAFLVYRDYSNKSQSYPIGTLDTTPPTPSSTATTTASGLIYEDLQAGDGATAQSGDSVSVNYTGWLADGTQFDSSIGGAPLDFTIGAGSVIAGWDEGVAGMRVNGTRLLVIPPSLAYGAAGSGTTIPANATLTFEVQLVAIK
jgi:FKBP-type peptidyl-prolyl cis-trans isomerase